MHRVPITIHLPSHRRQSLKELAPSAESTQAHDGNIGDHLRYLKEQRPSASTAA